MQLKPGYFATATPARKLLLLATLFTDSQLGDENSGPDQETIVSPNLPTRFNSTFLVRDTDTSAYDLISLAVGGTAGPILWQEQVQLRNESTYEWFTNQTLCHYEGTATTCTDHYPLSRSFIPLKSIVEGLPFQGKASVADFDCSIFGGSFMTALGKVTARYAVDSKNKPVQLYMAVGGRAITTDVIRFQSNS